MSDFDGNKAKAFLIQIKDARNKRAHDKQMSAREAYRLADVAQQFFELTPFHEVTKEFNSLRLAALELLIMEERQIYAVSVVSLSYFHLLCVSNIEYSQKVWRRSLGGSRRG